MSALPPGRTGCLARLMLGAVLPMLRTAPGKHGRHWSCHQPPWHPLRSCAPVSRRLEIFVGFWLIVIGCGLEFSVLLVPGRCPTLLHAMQGLPSGMVGPRPVTSARCILRSGDRSSGRSSVGSFCGIFY